MIGSCKRLIRARAAAGSQTLYARFAQRVLGRVFRPDISVADALTNVRLAKQKIDFQREREEKGFNVKLGRGGIREIEFIAQALQVALGGRDPWLRAPHTLISLGRLTERGLITKPSIPKFPRLIIFGGRWSIGCKWSTGCKRTRCRLNASAVS